MKNSSISNNSLRVLNNARAGVVEWDHAKDGMQTRKRALRVGELFALGAAKSLLGVADLLLKEGLSPSTVNRYVAAFRGGWRAAEEAGLGVGPAPAWRALREPRGRDRCPTKDEVTLQRERLMALNVSCAYLCYFLAESGLRVGEALKLTADDVSMHHSVAWMRITGSKSGKNRSVPVRPGLPVGGLPIPLTYSTFSRIWNKARAKDQDWFVPHTLRHYRASRLSEMGAPLPTIAAILGHGDWRTTARYTHVDAAGMARAALSVVA